MCVHVCVCMCVVGKGDEVRTNKMVGTSGLAHISMSGGLCSPLASTSGAATNKRAFCAGVSSSIQEPLSLSLSLQFSSSWQQHYIANKLTFSMQTTGHNFPAKSS